MSSHRFFFRAINAAVCAGGCPHMYNVRAPLPHMYAGGAYVGTHTQITYKFSYMLTLFFITIMCL